VDKTFVETLFVIALTNKRDLHHEQAQELSALYVGRQLITTDAVLLEIGNNLSARYRSEAIQIISSFLTSKDIEVVNLDEVLFSQAFDLYKTYTDKSWGLIDCVSFTVMRQRNIVDALTCDRHFAQAGFNALMLDTAN